MNTSNNTLNKKHNSRKERKKSILYIAGTPSPYDMDFYNKLGKSCSLVVCFLRRQASDRDKSWGKVQAKSFRAQYLRGIRTGVDSAICPGVLKYTKKGKYSYIIVKNYHHFSCIMAILYMRFRSIPYWIEGDGAFAGKGVGFKGRIKRFLVSGAEGYFSSCDEHDKYYLTYGASADKIYRYPFSSVNDDDIVLNKYLFKKQSNETETIDKKKWSSKYTIEKVDEFITEREKLRRNARQKLGFGIESKIVLFVGQFIHRKGIDVLLKASKRISRLHDDVEFVLVGGELPLKKHDLLARHGIITHPFVLKDELRVFFLAANIFVLPTREDIWGLVVNEALAYSLPVITTDRCNAGLELIKDKGNGFVYPVDDVESLTDKIRFLLENDKERKEMQVRAVEVVKEYTIEKMVERHIEVLDL